MNKRPTSHLLWQPATIVDDGDGKRWLEFESVSDCPRCRAGTGCGASQWARLFGPGSASRMALPKTCELPSGSEVRAGLSAGALLIAAVRVYLLPLLVFIAMLVGLDRLGVTEPLALVAGLGVAFLAVLLARGRDPEGGGASGAVVNAGMNPVIESRLSPCPGIEPRAE